MQKTHTELWEKCLEIFRDNLTEEQYESWFAPIVPVSYNNGDLVLWVSSPYFKEHIESTFLPLVSAVIRRVYGESTRLFYKYNTVSNHPETAVTSGGMTASSAFGHNAGLFST